MPNVNINFTLFSLFSFFAMTIKQYLYSTSHGTQQYTHPTPSPNPLPTSTHTHQYNKYTQLGVHIGQRWSSKTDCRFSHLAYKLFISFTRTSDIYFHILSSNMELPSVKVYSICSGHVAQFSRICSLLLVLQTQTH